MEKRKKYETFFNTDCTSGVVLRLKTSKGIDLKTKNVLSFLRGSNIFTDLLEDVFGLLGGGVYLRLIILFCLYTIAIYA